MVEVRQSEQPVRLEYNLPVPQGERAYEASIVKCDGDKILTIVRDITARKEAEQSLKKALDEVKQLKDQLHDENIYLQEEIRGASNFGEIIGQSESLRRVLHQAEQVAPLNTTVSIFGETGTGKELLAHAIHKLSPRSNHALVKVNCAALPGTLIESELFGHEKGAFTGADARRTGRFEIANRGTLFLDEVGELPLDLQAKLLRVLEEGEFERVGGSHTLKVDVRVIAATNRNLEEAVRKGAFRSDLYYRLSIFPITLPPLRERKEDIPILVTHLVKQLGKKLGKTIDAIPQDTMAKLYNYPWPGNVRELRNVIERAVIITQGSKLRLIDDLDSQALELELHEQLAVHGAFADVVAIGETLEQTEYNLILRTLKSVHWKVEGPGGAAELLNLHPSTLRSKMRKLGIERPRFTAQSN
jgi:transcriptional regulator with GAF, ATPase, and Fis domain